jgi:hypothetical protein
MKKQVEVIPSYTEAKNALGVYLIEVTPTNSFYPDAYRLGVAESMLAMMAAGCMTIKDLRKQIKLGQE